MKEVFIVLGDSGTQKLAADLKKLPDHVALLFAWHKVMKAIANLWNVMAHVTNQLHNEY
jgi:hypothetical protein